jgi:hypothetical protein
LYGSSVSTENYVLYSSPLVIAPARHGGRLLLLVAVTLFHLLLFSLFFREIHKVQLQGIAFEEVDRSVATFITLPTRLAKVPARSVTRLSDERAESKSTSNDRGSAITEPIVVNHESPIAPIDWFAEGERAAASTATSAPATYRSFGKDANTSSSERRKASFAWDKTHTQRTETLPDGGTLIRLSANCVLVIKLIPLAACGLGKQKARGDLFDDMNKFTELGDWKDNGAP